MLSKPFLIVTLGHTGHGKSQLCNFIIKDLNNSKFKVSSGFDSQTAESQCVLFNRKINNEVFQLELIDTAGCGDTAKEDEENFKKLIDKLKEKKYVDLFLLVFNFQEPRIDGPTREYIKLIANTFTPTEFYNHLAIIFTHFPENPTEDDKKMKIMKTEKIIDLIKQIIGLNDDQAKYPLYIYELDTKKYNDNFILKFQETIDSMLIKMKENINKIGSVNTENIKYCGVKERLIEEQKKLELQKLEFERLKKLEEEKKKKEEEEMRRQEEMIKEERRRQRLERQRIEEERWRKEEYIRRREEEMRREEEILKKRLEQMELEKERKIKEHLERVRQLEYERKKKESGFCPIF